MQRSTAQCTARITLPPRTQVVSNDNANASFHRNDGDSSTSSKPMIIQDKRLCDALREELGLASTTKEHQFYKLRQQSPKQKRENAQPRQQENQPMILTAFVNKAA